MTVAKSAADTIHDDGHAMRQKSADLIRKSFADQATTLDAAQGLVEAFVNTGEVKDLQKDVMHFGCWSDVIHSAKTGESDWPAVCWSHASGMDGPLVVVGKVI